MRKRSILIAVTLPLVAFAASGAAQPGHGRHHGSTLQSTGAQPNPSIFGIDTGTYDAVHSHYLRDFRTARRLGARWDRFTLGPATAGGDFSTVDDEVTRARKQHMGVILSFRGIPGACSTRPAPASIGRCAPTTSTDLRRYRAYMRRVLLRYRHVVSYYESWIEINHDTSLLNAAQYAALLTAQHRVFDAVNRSYHLHLRLLFGSAFGFSIKPGSHWKAVLPFTHDVLDDLRGAEPFDGIALHAYRFPPGTEGPSAPDCDYVGGISVSGGNSTSSCPSPSWRLLTWPEELQAYEQLFSEAGYGQPPLWLTEFGWPGNPVSSGSYYPSDADQARYLKDAYRDLLQLPFVRGALWFNLRDYRPGIPTPDPGFFYHYGLLHYDYSSKSAGTQFSALARANPHR